MRPPAVVDASVVLKWQLDDEEAVEQAVTLRDAWLVERRVDLVAPSLCFYEVLNGLLVAARRGRIGDEEAKTAADLLLGRLGLTFLDPPYQEILSVAMRFGISAYDAAYVALGEVLDCDVWTGDRRLYRRLRGKAPRVRWIGDFEGT